MKRNLTNTAIKNAKAQADGKPKKYGDGGGLFLLVKSSSAGITKFWRYKYRVLGKEKTLSIGTYPEVGLKEARAIHDDARAQLAKGVDPSAPESRKREIRAR